MKNEEINQTNLESAIRQFLTTLGIEVKNEFEDTPKLMSEFYSNFFTYLHQEPPDLPLYPVPKANLEDIFLKDITFYSLCSHHFLPIFGTISLAYRPSEESVLGFSGIVRLVRYYSQRPTIQESLVNQIADCITERVGKMSFVFVKVIARQMCVEMRGVRVSGMQTICTASRNATSEWLNSIQIHLN